MLRVGLTGGIASGKTTISRLFEKLGIDVIDTDVISHELMQPNQAAYHRAAQHFGADILNDDLTVNRSILRKKIFNQPRQKQWLEKMIHPLIWERSEKALLTADSEYVLVVVPLMFESGFDQLVDVVIAIDCPSSTQKRRLVQRDGINEDLAEKMISAQMTNEQRILMADHVIQNKDEQDRAKNVLQLDVKFKQLARGSKY